MKTTVHHTCRKEGTKENILQNAPFKAEYNENEQKLQFLGSGYYFWDNNIEMARFWGKKHYQSDYYIIEATLELKKSYFLDLVGNREHMIYFMKLKETFKKFGFDREKWSMGHFIEFLKKLELDEKKGVFPFKIIRALDYSPNTKYSDKVNFVGNKKNYTLLNPRIIICLIEIIDNILYDKKIVS